MNLILLGAPGAGKGTQADAIRDAFSIPAISTGNLLREDIKLGTPAGLKAKDYMDAGQLVPDDIVVDVLKERIVQDDCKKGFILDGFPRSIPQAEALEKMGVNIDKVISIEVDDDEIIRRIAGRRTCSACGASYHVTDNPPKHENICDRCGSRLTVRDDDTVETIKSRLEVYHKQTEPLKSFYESEGKLIIVFGQKDVKDTTRLTLKALEG